MDFVEQIAAKYDVPTANLLVDYLSRKTRAADRGSKARRSLGNLYTLLVLSEDFLAARTSRFTDLMVRIKALPFGAKLQNHPLDNRLNDEFKRAYHVNESLFPVQEEVVLGQRGRKISIELLTQNGADPTAVAQVVVEVVYAYVNLITANQTNILDELNSIETLEDLREFFEDAFAPTSDARLFEIGSYVLLAEHYRHRFIYIGDSPANVRPQPLKLFRTGRTNANDGGIDFVLQPLGKFFQVTETLDFRKYFLDFEKINRCPMSFVVKIEGNRETVLRRVWNDAVRANHSEALLNSYMNLFEDIFTLTDLAAIVRDLPAASVPVIKASLSLQFKLEYGLLN